MLKSKCEQMALERACYVTLSQLRDLTRQLEDANAEDHYATGLVVGLLKGAAVALESIDWGQPMRSGGKR